MKTLLIFFPLIIIKWSVSGQSLDGTYYGKVGEVFSSLILEAVKDSIIGNIDAGGYRYYLNGIVSGSSLEGRILDPQTGGILNFSGNYEKGGVNLTVLDPQTGNSIELSFSSNGGGITNGTSPEVTPREGNHERDPALVGNWLYSESYNSGDYGFVSQWRLIVNADGTYLYGDAKLAGGGPGTSASSEGGGYTQGQWKTQNKTIFINEGTGWQPYAGYYIEGNSMLMKFSDGSKQVWKRN
jgi:hypothetical protein